jgi:hypothetical protein
VVAMFGLTSPEGAVGKFVLDYLFGTIFIVITGPVANVFNWVASIAPSWLSGLVAFVRAAPVYIAGSIIVDLPVFGMWAFISNKFDGQDEGWRRDAIDKIATAKA